MAQNAGAPSQPYSAPELSVTAVPVMPRATVA